MSTPNRPKQRECFYNLDALKLAIEWRKMRIVGCKIISFAEYDVGIEYDAYVFSHAPNLRRLLCLAP